MLSETAKNSNGLKRFVLFLDCTSNILKLLSDSQKENSNLTSKLSYFLVNPSENTQDVVLSVKQKFGTLSSLFPLVEFSLCKTFGKAAIKAVTAMLGIVKTA